jgi:hypothetical protein
VATLLLTWTALCVPAVDNALLNSDAYSARASDYSMYVDAQAGSIPCARRHESPRPIEGGMAGAAADERQYRWFSSSIRGGCCRSRQSAAYRLLAARLSPEVLGHVQHRRALAELTIWRRREVPGFDRRRRETRPRVVQLRGLHRITSDEAEASLGPVSRRMSLKIHRKRQVFLLKSLHA